MSFLLHFVGVIVFVAGLGWIATLIGISQTYVAIAALVLLGLGLFTAVARTRPVD